MSESQDQPPYLGIFFVATAGQNGPNLGSDEEEIVLLVLSILNATTNEVVCTSPFLVQPRTADINENLLSEECKIDFKLSDDQVKNAITLETAIEKLDEVVQLNTAGSEFTLVVDGQLPLRQCLHPEACAKNINLPDYYNSFYDLKKEFAKHYATKAEEITEMIEHLGLNLTEENEESTLVQANQMTRIVQRIYTDGFSMSEKELIQMKLEPGICSKFEEVDSNCVVRARGLPWQSSDQDIAKFFRGLNISKGGVALCLSLQGRRNGEALVRFESQEHRDMALKRHKHHIATRYIEVYKATGDDFINVAGGSNNEAQAFLSKGGQVIVRMRGLPYDCTAKQVLDFFNTGEKPCETLDGEEGVLFVRRPDGRATGDAFVLFAAEEDAAKALSKHRESIGSRYIELFRSTTAEVQQVLNRCLEPKAEVPQQLPLVAPVPPVAPQVAQVPQVAVPILPQHIITSGTRKDCIRLRGLPYEAQVEHILEFLGEHADNIVYQGVHMVYNPQGQPSGEAFIQMNSEQGAYLAAQAKHHRYMMHFKKQRYIEVFQCSGDDMNLVLTGGMPSPPKTLVSPGMLSPSGGATIMPMNVHQFSPLSPHQPQQQQHMMRQNHMAAAIAASMRPNMNHSQQPNPALLSFLSQLNQAQLGAGNPALGFHQPGILGSPPGASPGLMGSPPNIIQHANFGGLSHSPNLPSPLPSPTPEEVAVQRHLLNSQLFSPLPMQASHMIFNNMMANHHHNHARASPPAPHPQHFLINGNGMGAALNPNGCGKRSWDDVFNGIETAVVSPKRLRHHNSHLNNAAALSNGLLYGFPPKSPANP